MTNREALEHLYAMARATPATADHHVQAQQAFEQLSKEFAAPVEAVEP